jgi:hypothetical protein
MSGKGDVRADEGPKVKKKRKVMYIRETGGVGQIGQWKENFYIRNLYGVNESTILSSRKMKTKSGEVLSPVFHRVRKFLV